MFWRHRIHPRLGLSAATSPFLWSNLCWSFCRAHTRISLWTSTRSSHTPAAAARSAWTMRCSGATQTPSSTGDWHTRTWWTRSWMPWAQRWRSSDLAMSGSQSARPDGQQQATSMNQVRISPTPRPTTGVSFATSCPLPRSALPSDRASSSPPSSSPSSTRISNPGQAPNAIGVSCTRMARQFTP